MPTASTAFPYQFYSFFSEDLTGLGQSKGKIFQANEPVFQNGPIKRYIAW